MKALTAKVAAEPSSYIMTAAAAVAALIVAFAHLSPGWAGLASGACTAAGTIATAILARPVNYAAISGVAGILVQSFLLSSVHWTSGQQAAVVAALNVAVGFFAMRPGLTPVATDRAIAQAVRMTRAHP